MLDLAKKFLSSLRDSGTLPHSYYHLSEKTGLRYKQFQVEDPDTAERLYDWYQQCHAAHLKVSAHVDARISRGQHTSYIDYGEDGVLQRVRFTDFAPHGWRIEGEEDGAWTYPFSDEALSDIRALPRLAPHSTLNAMVGWPAFTQEDLEDGHVSAAQVRIFPSGNTETGATYISVPLPENFRNAPHIAEEISHWLTTGKPDFLIDMNKSPAAAPKAPGL